MGENDISMLSQENSMKFWEDTKFSTEMKSSAVQIWNFICECYHEYRPSSITVTHYLDGTVSIKYNHSLHFGPNMKVLQDENLLYLVSLISEKSKIRGKVYLNTQEGYLNNLSFSFSYAN